ncbi:hypothetical protein COLO4_34523 [Corchorus olitorius]|uniref:Uncharacterized protein n=1 Tax=Corchorus olitorius TaxID=93759 RepID=A0A1R3GKI1_9ROSI|nr:hypothetical protein COLO4_34523 [Corchorus olitorius]
MEMLGLAGSEEVKGSNCASVILPTPLPLVHTLATAS